MNENTFTNVDYFDTLKNIKNVSMFSIKNIKMSLKHKIIKCMIHNIT